MFSGWIFFHSLFNFTNFYIIFWIKKIKYFHLVSSNYYFCIIFYETNKKINIRLCLLMILCVTKYLIVKIHEHFMNNMKYLFLSFPHLNFIIFSHSIFGIYIFFFICICSFIYMCVFYLMASEWQKLYHCK